MKSLSISATQKWNLPNCNLTTVAFGLEEECIYALSEAKDEGSDLTRADVYKLQLTSGTEVLKPHRTLELPVSSTSSSANHSTIASLRFLGETQSLAVISRSGTIGLASLEDDLPDTLEIIGSIEAGINTASWSPDESLLVIATCDNKLLLMTNTFDVISEQDIRTVNEGDSQQVNVGWGSKQTQFHGSLGKAAAKSTPQSPDTIGSSPDDDGQVRISWRGDGAYFAVNSLEEPLQYEGRKRRVLRVYDRQCVLQNTAEPVAGLEHVLSWRPSGNLIACTQRFGFEGGGAGRANRHDVVFFERNGLRHGEFTLRESAGESSNGSSSWGYRVKEALWNADSSILALWIESEHNDKVQLWTIGNYHWYLKQEIDASDNKTDRFTHVSWHPEHALTLLLMNQSSLKQLTLAWDIYASRLPIPNDTGCVAVVDGENILLTPFRTQNVPPPMASHTLRVGEQLGTPIHVAFSPCRDYLAVLSSKRKVKVWSLRTRLGAGKEKAIDPQEICTINLSQELESTDFRQICIWENSSASESIHLALLGSTGSLDWLSHVKIVGGSNFELESALMLPGVNGRLINPLEGLYWQSSKGSIHFVPDPLPEDLTQICRFSEFCFQAEAARLEDDKLLFVGRSAKNRLYCTASGIEDSITLASNCTSFAITSGFLVFSTLSHEASFAPLDALYDRLLTNSSNVTASPQQWEQRRIERGAQIVTAVPSSMALVLQMPRGNLETIYPRPMVLAVVKRDIEAGNYRKAFLECRKHRLDLSILVETDSEKFLSSVSSFVDQLDDVDHLNLFLTSLGQTINDPKKLAGYCDEVRKELEARDLARYINSVLTALVVKKPPDHEAALSLLHRLRDKDSELVEEAVKYIIFLVDADKLFDVALGMYDFSLVLLIAQHSQRDPREYLPFLRELRALPKYYQRYRIDDHLKKHANALENLRHAGTDYFEQALGYIEKHQLYLQALKLWSDEQDHYERILDIYGEYKFERREYRQAALVFVEARRCARAIVAYEHALLWREVFVLAKQESFSDDDIQAMAQRIGDELLAQKRHSEAATVFYDYAHDLRQSINALVQGNLFSEARRLIALHDSAELLADIVYPAAHEFRSQIPEDLGEMRTQLFKQVERLRELRVKKVEEPDAFYGVEDDPALHGVDVMTDVSMAPTAFTRYTAAPTTTSKASKRSSRSKRKMERKVGSGRKGTIDEEEYLLRSIEKLVKKFETLQDDVAQLIPHLLQFTDEHRAGARSLQNEVEVFHAQLQEALDEIWPSKTADEEQSVPTSSWAERMEEKRRERKAAVDAILKPELKDIAQKKIDIL